MAFLFREEIPVYTPDYAIAHFRSAIVDHGFFHPFFKKKKTYLYA